MKRERTPSLKRKIMIPLLIFLAIFIILLLGAYLSIHTYINRMHLVSASGFTGEEQPKDDARTASDVPEYEEADSQVPNSPEDEITSMEEKIKANLKEGSSPILYDKDVFNVLLIGSDTRENGGRGRSDVMLLISINKKNKQIIATSFLRDIYLKIPGKNNNRLNAAYAFGGADLLMETLEQNFKIKIDHYASIDFYSFIDIVDAVGGITLTVSKEDIPVINDYLKEINILTGDKEGTDYLTEAGTYLLDGKQALAYSRNRYVGNGDFARTQRQRNVLEQIFLKVKELNLLQLKELLDTLLPEITTNLTEGEIFSLLLALPSYINYERLQWSVPTEDSYQSMRINGMAVLGIDFDQNIREIYQRIYGIEAE